MTDEMYEALINKLKKAFGERLRTMVLFGSRARGKVKGESDHDIFIVIDDLPDDPIDRQKEIRQAVWEIPLRLNTISKTPEEVEANLTPFMLDICVDGICLYGGGYFEPLRRKALASLKNAGLIRKRVGQEWRWEFEKMPTREWELTWEGYREFK